MKTVRVNVAVVVVIMYKNLFNVKQPQISSAELIVGFDLLSQQRVTISLYIINQIKPKVYVNNIQKLSSNSININTNQKVNYI